MLSWRLGDKFKFYLIKFVHAEITIDTRQCREHISTLSCHNSVGEYVAILGVIKFFITQLLIIMVIH